MRSIFFTIFSLINLLMLSSCNDVLREGDWIVCNVIVVEANTQEPIDAEVYITSHHNSPGSSSGNSTLFIGKTDPSGYLHIELELINENQDNDYRIMVRRNGYIAATPYGGGTYESIFSAAKIVYANENNNFEFQLDPFYSFTLKAKNINCTGPTDSVWIDWTVPYNMQRQAYGCADSLLTGYYPSGAMEFYHFPNTSSVDFTITTKKAGVVNTYNETYNLTLGNTPDPIVIEY